MSLRARLTLLYTALVGGILLLLGVAVYRVVYVTLYNQVDNNLASTAYGILQYTQVSNAGQISVVRLPSLDQIPTDVYVQAWSRDHQLRDSTTKAITTPFDPATLDSTTPVYSNVTIGNVRLRVLTVPVVVGGGDRIVGTLQIATKLAIVDTTQRILLSILIAGTLIAIVISALAVWISTYRALAPLNDVTQTALQITHANDLSRRIPYHGPPKDEVGQLINAFNQTLSRLERLFNTQRRFMTDVGHELRTPLTVIKGNVQLIQRMGVADQESLENIVSEVDRLTRLVGDLLLLSQAESGKLPLDIRLVELDTLVLEAMQQMRVLTRDRIQLKLGEIDQVLVCGDRDRLKQVLVNLIGNALNYTPTGGEVIVGVGKSGNKAELTVTDTGPGIPPEDLPHIFERFYRGEKSRTRSKDGKGFGLGLSIVYWIIQNHEGNIDVNSTAGKGTTFCVTLPLAQGECEKRNPDNL
jgi:heavy metal sensor kinase